MQKLQHFELDLKVCEDNIGSLGCLGFSLVKVAFRNLKYYFFNASLFVLLSRLIFFKWRVYRFCKA